LGPVRLDAALSDLRQLGVGRRLAVPARDARPALGSRRRRLRRQRRRPRHGRCGRLLGRKILGPRIGKFGKDGKPRAIPGHDLPMAVLGTFILLVGWMGFNGGSTFAGTDFRLTVVITNTILASAFGCLAAMFLMWKLFGKPDPSMTANGLLAGL